MKLSAIAIDYDGTIASNDVLEPSVRDAIADVRRRGILVVLATGRRLDDLRRVAGDLTTFDIVVAENGAVLEFPASGRHGFSATRLRRPSSTNCAAARWSSPRANASSKPTRHRPRSCWTSCGRWSCR